MFFWLEILDLFDRAARGFKSIVGLIFWLFMVGLMLAVFQLWDHQQASSGRSGRTLSTFSDVVGSVRSSFEQYAPAVASSGAATAQACLADEGGILARAVGLNFPMGKGDCGQAGARTAQLLPAASMGTAKNAWNAIQPVLPNARAALPSRMVQAMPVAPVGPVWYGGGR